MVLGLPMNPFEPQHIRGSTAVGQDVHDAPEQLKAHLYDQYIDYCIANGCRGIAEAIGQRNFYRRRMEIVQSDLNALREAHGKLATRNELPTKRTNGHEMKQCTPSLDQ